MTRSQTLAFSLLATAGLACAGLSFAADAPTTAPTTAPTLVRPMTKSGKPRAIRLVQPWSKIEGLSEDQKIQIFMLHEEYADKINALKEEEQAKSMAVLTDAQKAQLSETLGADKAAKKAAPAAAEPAK